jgi:hypothetical protein
MTGFANNIPSIALFNPESAHNLVPIVAQKVSLVSGPVMTQRYDWLCMVGLHFATRELTPASLASVQLAWFSGERVDSIACECSVNNCQARIPSGTAQSRHDE